MKSRIPLYIFVFLFSIFFLTGCTSRENIDISQNLVKEGLELYEDRYYTKALHKFSEALEKYPVNFEAYIGLMDVLLDKGFFEEAESLANEAAIRVNDTEAASLYSMIGDKYYEIGKYEEARNIYEKGLNYDGDYEDGRIGLAGAFIQMGEVREAKDALGKRGESDNFLLLYSYLTLDDWNEGKKKIDNIEDSNIKERLDEIYKVDDEDALYKSALLAREYINSGYPYLAIELLGNQEDEIEQYPDGQYFLGKAYLDYGNYEKSIEKLNMAAALDMDDDQMYLNLARAYFFNDNLNEALSTYEIIISPTSLEILDEYIDVLMANNMLEEAENTLVGFLSEKESFGLNMLLVKVYYEKNDFEGMGSILAELEKETDLNQAEAGKLKRYKLLYLTEEIEDAEEVDILIERFSVFDRYSPELYLFRGKLLKYKGETLEAKEAFERAIELDLDGSITEQVEDLLATID